MGPGDKLGIESHERKIWNGSWISGLVIDI
jgi:hypothetical protein